MIRKMMINEVTDIKKLIDPFVRKGLLLPKSLHSLCTSMRDFWVMAGDDDPHEIMGCCALQISWTDMAEIRTLAVKKEYQGRGIGRDLVTTCIREAAELKIETLFTLTFVPEFFKKAGFAEVDKSTLPNKIWSDCIHCQYFPDCREVALVYKAEG